MKGIYFEHITDEMRKGKKYDNIKTAIEEMHEKTKQKLQELEYVYNIEYTIGEPYFLDRSKHEKDRNQYRYNVRIRKDKTNRKITRNKIYEEMNKIYCTSYTNI